MFKRMSTKQLNENLIFKLARMSHCDGRCWCHKFLEWFDQRLPGIKGKKDAQIIQGQLCPENTNLLCKGKYQCTADLLFFLFGFSFFAHVKFTTDVLV